MKVCSAPGCDRPHDSRGYCKTHAKQMRRFGVLDQTTYARARSRREMVLAWVESRDRTDGCWRIDGPTIKGGYPRIGRVKLGHLVLIADGRPRPDGSSMLHSCDEPGCLNPDHLRWGTEQENAEDRVARFRQPQGERHWAAKLTDDQVREIRGIVGLPYSTIAVQYGVSAGTISDIRRGASHRATDGRVRP